MLRFRNSIFSKTRFSIDWAFMERRRKPGLRDAGFAGYLHSTRFHHRNPDKGERALSFRRKIAFLGFALLVLGFGWLVVESARAFTLF